MDENKESPNSRTGPFTRPAAWSGCADRSANNLTSDITQAKSGMYYLFIHNGSNRLLPLILNEAIPWVWVLGHRPNTYVEWWNAELPLSRTGRARPLRARNVAFDLGFEISQFLDVYEEFLDHSIVLYQSTKPMPDTLLDERIDEEVLDEVLRQNGVYLYFQLPHAHETCEVACWDRLHLERIQAQLSGAQNGESAGASPPRVT